MTPYTGVAGEILKTLGVWAPWIWSGSSALGLVVCGWLWRSVRASRLEPRQIDDDFEHTLELYERLALTAGFMLVSLIFVGVASKVFPANPWVAIGTLAFLLVLPAEITWIVYRAFRVKVANK